MALTCDMEKGCTGSVTYVDNKGYVYCTVHGCIRRTMRPCRRLTAAEIATLTNGGTISYQAVTRASTLTRKALGTLIREELERRGMPVIVEVDQAPPACGALRYTIDGAKLSPGQAAEHLGIVWP